MPTVLVDRCLVPVLYCTLVIGPGCCLVMEENAAIQVLPPQTSPLERKDQAGRPKVLIPQQKKRMAPARNSLTTDLVREIQSNPRAAWKDGSSGPAARRDSNPSEGESVTYFRLTESARLPRNTPSTQSRSFTGVARINKPTPGDPRYPYNLSTEARKALSPLPLRCRRSWEAQIPWKWRTLQENGTIALNMRNCKEVKSWQIP